MAYGRGSEPFRRLGFTATVLDHALRAADDELVAAQAVRDLGDYLVDMRKLIPVTPVNFLGIFDGDTDAAVRRDVRDWGDFSASPHYLNAGIHTEARDSGRFTPAYLTSLFPPELQGRVSVHSPEPHVTIETASDQAMWVMDKVEELQLPAIAVRAWSFHNQRAFRTMLGEANRRQNRVIIMPWYRRTFPYRQYPLTEPWAQSFSMMDLIPTELAKAWKYPQAAKPEEVRSYCEWLATESPVAAAFGEH